MSKAHRPGRGKSRDRSSAPGAGKKRRIEAKETTQVTFWVDTRWPGRADHLAKKLSTSAVPLSRTDAYRAAMAAGFESLEGGARR